MCLRPRCAGRGKGVVKCDVFEVVRPDNERTPRCAPSRKVMPTRASSEPSRRQASNVDARAYSDRLPDTFDDKPEIMRGCEPDSCLDVCIAACVDADHGDAALFAGDVERCVIVTCAYGAVLFEYERLEVGILHGTRQGRPERGVGPLLVNFVAVTGRVGERVARRGRRKRMEEGLRELSFQAGKLGRVWPTDIPKKTTAAGGGGRPETGDRQTEGRNESKADEHEKMSRVRHEHRGRERRDHRSPVSRSTRLFPEEARGSEVVLARSTRSQ